MTGGQIGYAEIPEDPTQPWKFQAASPCAAISGSRTASERATSTATAAPICSSKTAGGNNRKRSTAEPWAFHEVKFSEPGGSQMYAYDFDGDGDNDVLTAKEAHSYGLSWFEQVKDGDEIKFIEHKFMGEKPEENDYGVAFSQLHAVDLADMDGDGVLDIVTGKRWWAHAEHDPGSLGAGRALLVPDGARQRHGAIRAAPDRQQLGRRHAGDRPAISTATSCPTSSSAARRGRSSSRTRRRKSTRRRGTSRSRSCATASRSRPSASMPPIATRLRDGETADGFPATAEDGRRLNLDFEKGNLTDWTATGQAFANQPIEGNTVHDRIPDGTSNLKGLYWIGTYEGQGDHLQGELTSIPFKVTHPYASFLVGGGSGERARRADHRQGDGQGSPPRQRPHERRDGAVGGRSHEAAGARKSSFACSTSAAPVGGM